MNYDVHFALRLCQDNADLKEACVQLSGLLGLWESAVDLALTINLKLAKQLADMPPEEDVELRKKLWLKIGKSLRLYDTKRIRALMINTFSATRG